MSRCTTQGPYSSISSGPQLLVWAWVYSVSTEGSQWPPPSSAGEHPGQGLDQIRSEIWLIFADPTPTSITIRLIQQDPVDIRHQGELSQHYIANISIHLCFSVTLRMTTTTALLTWDITSPMCTIITAPRGITGDHIVWFGALHRLSNELLRMNIPWLD